MGFSEEAILQWFSQYAYQPTYVYLAVIAFMVAGSFGLPVPEEVVLIGAGIVGYMGTQPDQFPPPYAGAPTVDIELLALISFLSVFFADFLVFNLGRIFGARFLESRYMERYRPRMEKVMTWVKSYGAFAAGIFRFTPGLRFPGHFSCGMLGLPVWKFIAVDGSAALISVPTQVILVAYFGQEIIIYFKQFKLVLIGLGAAALIGWFIYRRINRSRNIAST